MSITSTWNTDNHKQQGNFIQVLGNKAIIKCSHHLHVGDTIINGYSTYTITRIHNCKTHKEAELELVNAKTQTVLP